VVLVVALALGLDLGRVVEGVGLAIEIDIFIYREII
jgi:hypothetical protein